jgi:hypothetical protein
MGNFIEHSRQELEQPLPAASFFHGEKYDIMAGNLGYCSFVYRDYSSRTF